MVANERKVAISADFEMADCPRIFSEANVITRVLKVKEGEKERQRQKGRCDEESRGQRGVPATLEDGRWPWP